MSRREIGFRRALWLLGVRGYRVHPRLPGRPDLYFPTIQLAVFINGCYWHRCHECGLKLPTANVEFWREKFEANIRRDHAAGVALRERGLDIEIVWEHELRPDPVARATALAELVGSRRSARTSAERGDTPEGLGGTNADAASRIHRRAKAAPKRGIIG